MLRKKYTNIFTSQESLVNQAVALHQLLRSEAVMPQDIPMNVLTLGSLYKKILENDSKAQPDDYQAFLAERGVYAADIKQYLLDMKADIATTPWGDAMPAWARKINFQLEDLQADHEVAPDKLLNTYHKIIQLFNHVRDSHMDEEACSFLKQHRGEIAAISYLPLHQAAKAKLSK